MGDHEGIRRAQRAVMVDPGVLTFSVEPPGGRKYWLDESMLPLDKLGKVKPTFRIGEVARIFFARSSDWLRLMGQQQSDDSVLDVKRTESGSRIYTLVDVEKIAHTLLEAERISMRQFVGAISIIRWMAYSYGILSDQDMVPPEPAEDGDVQPPITGVDEEIRRVLMRNGSCDACQRDQHQDCETAAQVAEMTWRGHSVLQIGDPCPCYADDPERHQ